LEKKKTKTDQVQAGNWTRPFTSLGLSFPICGLRGRKGVSKELRLVPEPEILEALLFLLSFERVKGVTSP
jgi:hypothetical protein